MLSGKALAILAILAALAGAGLPVHVYGSHQRGSDGPLTFLPLSNLPFL